MNKPPHYKSTDSSGILGFHVGSCTGSSLYPDLAGAPRPFQRWEAQVLGFLGTAGRSISEIHLRTKSKIEH